MSQRWLALALIAALGVPAGASAAAYTYHGDLLDGAAPAEGRYDLRARALAGPDGGKALGEPIEQSGVELRDGHFSVELDLPDAADGNTWVEVSVRKSNSGEDYDVLGAPLQLAKVNSTCPGAWALDGNTGVPAGSYLGIGDFSSSQELSLRVRGSTVLRLVPTGSGSPPNIIGGMDFNFVRAGALGATISGGGATGAFNLPNAIYESYGTIGGGFDNEAGSIFNGIGQVHLGTVGGGRGNRAVGIAATVPGGRFNRVFGDNGFAAGYHAYVGTGHTGSFVWSDDASDFDFETSGPRQFLVRAQGGMGINTNRFGAAVDLRLSELVIKNPDANGNVDMTLLNQSNRGYGLASVPGAGGAAGEFYISETDARTANVGFTNRLRIDANGTTFVQGGAVGMLSDARLKKNIGAIESPLHTLLGLQGRVFEYSDPAKSMSAPGLRMGFIAQDVQKVLPGWVKTTGAEGYLAVTPIGFEALTVEAIRDLKAETDVRIENLEAENAELRDIVETMRGQLARIEKQTGLQP